MAKVNTKLNAEVKKVVGQLKTAQKKFQQVINNKNLVEDLRGYAEKQGKELKKLLSADVSKVKTFIERERKELDKLQKQLPGELQKIGKFLGDQRKEFEKVIKQASRQVAAKKGGKTASKKKAAAPKKKATSKSSTAKKKSTSKSESQPSA
jgi:hypothetical protein